MSSKAPQTPFFEACTVCRNIESFEQLIDEMDQSLGEDWGDLPFQHLPRFLVQESAKSLRFLTFAIDSEDDLAQVGTAIDAAKEAEIKVILVAQDLSPADLHQLLRRGGDEFIPYPLPPNALAEAIVRLETDDIAESQALAQNTEQAAAAPEPTEAAPTEQAAAPRPVAQRKSGEAGVFAVQGLCGGSGASTLAINLANELSQIDKKAPPRVCLLDFDFQFGAAASLLDLPQRPAVIEVLSDTEAMDEGSFLQALQQVGENLFVLTTPEDLIPLDFVNGADIARMIAMAGSQFDYVVIDMPRTIVDWTETVLTASHVYFALLESDLRSAQNCVRFRNALMAEGLPAEKLRFVLNRAPKFTDLNGRSRVKRLCESLDIALEVQLPDGGKPITQAADQGEPLAQSLPKNPLRKEILSLANEIHKLTQTGS